MMKMNGFQTQGENIADNGGIKESFRVFDLSFNKEFLLFWTQNNFISKAYKKWASKNGPEPLLPGMNYNQDQLFFINFGQVWCSKYKEKYLEKAIKTNVHSLGQYKI